MTRRSGGWPGLAVFIIPTPKGAPSKLCLDGDVSQFGHKYALQLQFLHFHPYSFPMPWSLHRFQQNRDVHLLTFSCYKREPLLRTPAACRAFENTLERVRLWYGITINGYVVMPEHVHLLLHEPERAKLSVAIQMLKQIVGRKLSPTVGTPFWQRRYHDRNIHGMKQFNAALRYIHRNPVKRKLCARPEDWPWSSFLHHATGVEGVIEIESMWTARKRERLGVVPTARVEPPHPPRQTARGRIGHKQFSSVGI
jgi:putative transposase